MFNIILQLHGSSSTTTTQTYKPTDAELKMQQLSADYAQYVMPNAKWLNDTAYDVLKDSVGTVQVDFDSMNNAAQQQIANAQQGVANLANGELPASYQTAMENSIKSGVTNTVGNAINSLGNRGILNSSVTNQAMNDISKNASNTMAEQYSNNISTLNGLYGQQAQLANSGITTAAASQEAAQSPALQLWNASLGLNGATTSTLGAIAGQGTTTSTQGSSGSGILGAGLGLASSAISAFCFVGDTEVLMATGDVKQIKDIEAGEKVISVDEHNEMSAINEVLEVQKPKPMMVYKITTIDDGGEEHKVTCTLSQPFMNQAGNYVLAAMLRINAELLGVGKVVAFERVGIRPVYDLKVANANNYLANGFVASGMIEKGDA